MTKRDDAFSILLISCYELGHQPAGIALPMALLQRAGYRVEALDVSVDGFDADKAARASFVGISVPMHTALRLGSGLAEQIRTVNPNCHICFYGLYALLNDEYLLGAAADSVIGGEFEEALVRLVQAVEAGKLIDIEGVCTREHASGPLLARIGFAVPERGALAPLDRYARLQYEGEERLAGYVEASRGCLHYCTHCPIPPVYGGRFFVVPRDIVLEDIRHLVAAGARHITFGDPDFLNGPRHSLAIASAMHREFPDLTFDFTAKIEHILKHRELIGELGRSGCIFAISAVESLSDTVLDRLDKGHSRDDVFQALRILSAAGIAMRPSFVPFTPWATIDDYVEILEFVETENLIDHVDPVQYSIRLLVPPGSLVLSLAGTERWLGQLVEDSFSYEWKHPDARMDELHARVSALVEEAASRDEDAAVTFGKIRDAAYAIRGDNVIARETGRVDPSRTRPPRLTESWFCCAEPTQDQLVPLQKLTQIMTRRS